MAVELDARAFKALSSPTRVELLKKLRQKPRSLTSLAEESGLSVQATDEHLHKLVQAGLVEKDKKSKWAYYRLTAAGNSLVQPDRQPVYLMLAVSLMLLLAAAITWNPGMGLPEFKTGSGNALENLPTPLAQGQGESTAPADAAANAAASSVEAGARGDGASSPGGADAVPLAAANKAMAVSNSTPAHNGSAPISGTNGSTAAGTKIAAIGAPSMQPPFQGAAASADAERAPTPASGIPWPLVFGAGGLASLLVAAAWWQKA